MPGSSIPLATLGTFILWLGWFGFNGASQLAMGTISDISDVSRIFVNTNMAAAGGVVATMILLQIIYKKVDVTMALNGALAGLVSITAEPLAPSVLAGDPDRCCWWRRSWFSPCHCSTSSRSMMSSVRFRFTCLQASGELSQLPSNTGNCGAQIIGIIAYGVFTVIFSLIVWMVIKAIIGIRVSEEEEALGLDKTEIGVEAYPEFASN